jgi:hypothetical protein
VPNAFQLPDNFFIMLLEIPYAWLALLLALFKTSLLDKSCVRIHQDKASNS